MKRIQWIPMLIVLGFMVLITIISAGSAFPVIASANVLQITSDFEDGTTMGWNPKGSEKLEASTEVAHTGKYSLKVTGRTNYWEGPEINLTDKLVKGQKYTVSAWVYQDSGAAHEIRLTAWNPDTSSANLYEGKFYVCVQNVKTESGKWAHLTGTFIFDYQGELKTSTLYFESPDTGYVLYVDDISITGAANAANVITINQDIPSIWETYKDYFPIGVAVPSSALNDAGMALLIKKHFNSITAEWEMKLGPIWRGEGDFDFSKSDQYVDFITKNHMRLRGHCLIWHIEQPDWIFKDSTNPAKQVSKEVLIQRMKKYISTVVGRYKGRIQCWDVVNEAIDTTQPQNLRNSKWLEIIGPEYLELAFKFAHEADPATKLFYNDFDTENPVKRQAIYDMVKALKDKGVPIDGIGCQGHISLNQPPVKNIEDTVKQFSKLGLVEITELDVSVFNSGNQTAIPKEVLIEQGYRYQQIMEMLKKYKNVFAGVTFWGLKDDMSWLSRGRTDAPLLFDKRFKEKYAYWGLVDPAKLPVRIKTYEAADIKPEYNSKPELPWDILKKENITSLSGQLTGGFRSFYDKKNIYLWININDPDKNNDSVDIFIDWENAKKESFTKEDSLTCAAYHLQWSKLKADNGLKTSIIKTTEGPVMVITIPIVKLNAENRIGLDIRVNHGTESISWNDSTNSQAAKSTNYGVLKLGKSPEYTKAIYGTPVIDGEKDPVWNKAKIIHTTKTVLGAGNIAKGKFRLLWDRNYLYVYGEIQDSLLRAVSSNPWEQDSVEFFIDQNFNRTSFYEDDDVQYRVNYKNVKTFGSTVVPNFKTSTKVVPGGYVVEAAIPLDKIQVKKGTLVGFDIQVNDDNGKGERTGQSNWNDSSGTGWQSTTVFGVLRLE